MRIVVLKPTEGWGGEGILGVEFATGLVNDFRDVLSAYKKVRESNTEDLESVEEEEIPMEKQASNNSNDPDGTQNLEVLNPEEIK